MGSGERQSTLLLGIRQRRLLQSSSFEDSSLVQSIADCLFGHLRQIFNLDYLSQAIFLFYHEFKGMNKTLIAGFSFIALPNSEIIFIHLLKLRSFENNFSHNNFKINKNKNTVIKKINTNYFVFWNT